MTISDVFVAAPWIVFAVALAVICIRLLRSRRRPLTRPRRGRRSRDGQRRR